MKQRMLKLLKAAAAAGTAYYFVELLLKAALPQFCINITSLAKRKMKKKKNIEKQVVTGAYDLNTNINIENCEYLTYMRTRSCST